MMSRKSLFVLFVASLVPFTVGNMLTNLLPVYSGELGASNGTTGFFMGSIFVAVAGGTAFSGWLSDVHKQRRSLLVLSGSANILLFSSLVFAESFGSVAVLTLASMFFVGAGQNTISVLVGLRAAEHERGRAFGIVGLTFGLGLLIGGFVSGPIVELGGFPMLFLVAALAFVIQPLVILRLQEDVPNTPQVASTVTSPQKTKLGLAFYKFSAASLFAFVAQFVGVLGRPLVMDELGFNIVTISIAFAASGAVLTPLTYFAGKASDRIARKPLIILAYMSTATGLLLMVGANSSWEFMSSAMLLSAVNVSLIVGLALVTDLVPIDRYGRAISIYNSTVWVGAIIGFTAAGSAIESVGSDLTFTGAFVLSMAAILLVFTVQEPTATTRLDVFVSSGVRDLSHHRGSVLGALNRMGVKTVNALSEPIEKTALRDNTVPTLHTADLFLGIYASEYGPLEEGQEASLIETEYETSGELGLPRLIYLVDPREDWAINHLDTGFYGAKMRIFLDRLKQENPKLRYFTTAGDLVEKLTADLAQFRTQPPASDYVKARHFAIGLLIVASFILIIALRVGASV